MRGLGKVPSPTVEVRSPEARASLRCARMARRSKDEGEEKPEPGEPPEPKAPRRSDRTKTLDQCLHNYDLGSGRGSMYNTSNEVCNV